MASLFEARRRLSGPQRDALQRQLAANGVEAFATSWRRGADEAAIQARKNQEDMQAALYLAGFFDLSDTRVGQSAAADSRQQQSSRRDAEVLNDRWYTFVHEYATFAAEHCSSLQQDPICLMRQVLSHTKCHPIARSVPEVKQWEALYDGLSQVFSKAVLVFQQSEAAWFSEVLRYLGVILLELALLSDALSRKATLPRVTDAASRLSKVAGAAGNDRTKAPMIGTKRRAAVWLANTSFKAYFKLNNLRLCSTVVGSVENAFKLNSINSSMGMAASGQEGYLRGDLVAYRYYIGRLRLNQHRIRLAYNELRWAFDNCSIQNMRNLRRIIIPLTASALILGILPSEQLLQELGLGSVFLSVMRAMQKGHGAAMMQALEKSREWFRARGIYLLLHDKLQVGCWRCLIRQALLVHRSRTPTEGAGPPTLPLHELLAMARLAWQDAELTLEDVESIVASLISQGYIKAYILHSKAIIVFQKGERMGLVQMNHVYSRDE